MRRWVRACSSRRCSASRRWPRAAQAGLQPGDVIVRLDDKPIDSVEDLFGELRQRKPESQARLTYIRDGQEQQATVTLRDRPN